MAVLLLVVACHGKAGMEGEDVAASTRLRMGQDEHGAQCAHVWVIGAERVVGIVDDALGQGDGVWGS